MACSNLPARARATAGVDIVGQTKPATVWTVDRGDPGRTDTVEVHPMTMRKGKTAAELMAEPNADQ